MLPAQMYAPPALSPLPLLLAALAGAPHPTAPTTTETEPQDEDGAWGVDPGLAAEMAAAGVDRCDLEAVGGASLDEARLLELSAAGRPFVVRNLTDRWAAHARWSPGYLRRRYGGLGSGDRQKAGSIKSFGLAIVDKADAEARATLTLDAYLRSLANRSDFEFLFGVRPPPCPSRRSSEPRNGHTTAVQRLRNGRPPP